MGRKRKLHLGNTPIGGGAMKSRRIARNVTSQYHVIQNERSLVMQNTTLSEEQKQERLAELEQRMTDIGGTNKYQQASIVSTQHFKTSKWVAGTLNKLGRGTNSANKLNVLEVGAINTQLQQYNWMNVRSIDLNSQHPSIEECDFFAVPPEGLYDVVVCSMVLNCVDEPVRRGEMLARLSCQLVPETGLLFFVLPKRCIHSHCVGGMKPFTALLSGLGLHELLPCRETPKLAFFVLGNAPPPVPSDKAPSQAKSTPTNANIQEATGNKQKFNQKVKVNKTTTTSVSALGWKDRARAMLAAHIRSDTLKHFTQDFSTVPANKFAITIPPDLVSSDGNV